MNTVVYDPHAIYETQYDGVIPVLYKSDFQTAGNNKTTISAVAGKRIKVIGAVLQTYGATAGTINFYSATTAGTLLMAVDTEKAVNQPPVILQPNINGYFETNTGEALNAQSVTGNQQWTLQYIVYTP